MIRVVFFIALLNVFPMKAQVNADREFVKKHKIQSAFIADGAPFVGITFYYDLEGRLTRSVQINWLYGPAASDVIYYDTLGRWIALLCYTVSDSTQLQHPEEVCTPDRTTRWIYSGDSIEIMLDSSWDKSRRLLDVQRREINRKVERMPAAPSLRPVFWCDAYISEQIEFRTWETYIYTNEHSMKPDTILRTGSISMLSCTLKDDRFICEEFSESFFKDSATFSRSRSVVTLHGRNDTITSSYKSCRTVPEDIHCAGVPEPKPTIGYLIAKKRFGKYHIKYNLFDQHHFEWRKVTSREPWYDPAFSCWIFMYNKPSVNNYETIANYSKKWHQKPIYTYWP